MLAFDEPYDAKTHCQFHVHGTKTAKASQLTDFDPTSPSFGK
jgi:hypothetical protein